ncbi:MAG: ABC transporter permease subunit [Actinomycetota bacterium]
MAWVTWRHHRIALGGVAIFLGGLTVWIWIAGLQLHHAYAAAIACHPELSTACMGLILNFHLSSDALKTGFPLQPVPALIGAFVGAPLLAGELESGTFRYAWTQGFERWRWTLAKLVMLAAGVAVMAGAFTVVLSWYYQPYFAAGNGAQLPSASPLSPGLFDLRGPAFAAWTLAAFAIGALAGKLTRRVVPAIVATLAGYTTLALVAGIVTGLTPWSDHHPASHFWPLQWIEASCLLAVSALLVGVTVWLVHRRAV